MPSCERPLSNLKASTDEATSAQGNVILHAACKDKFQCVEDSEGGLTAIVCGKVRVQVKVPKVWPRGAEVPEITSMTTPSGVQMSKGIVNTLNQELQTKRIRDVHAMLLLAEQQMITAFP